MSNPTVLPAALTSVFCWPPDVLLNVVELFVTEMNFSVVEALCALATAGSTSAPVVPRTTAAPAAARDVRRFMMPLLSAGVERKGERLGGYVSFRQEGRYEFGGRAVVPRP